MDIQIEILEHGKGLEIPCHATEDSAGLDLRAAVNENVILKPGQRTLVPAGFLMAVPQGYNAEIRPRSGLAFKNGITVLNSPGTIDSDYRGEIKVLLINLGENDFVIERGMRIAQMVIQKYEKTTLKAVDSLDVNTSRASGGYGSTGVK